MTRELQQSGTAEQVRAKALQRTCPTCHAAPDQKCAADRAGRLRLHRDRIRDAEQALEPLPPRYLLSRDGDRTFMEVDPEAADTPVVSVHRDVLRELTCYPYEMGVLMRLALLEAGAFDDDGPRLKNLVLAFCTGAVNFLAHEEVVEAAERLVARGFVRLLEDGTVAADQAAVDIIRRPALSASFRMEWNAAKAAWPGKAMAAPGERDPNPA
ncbi:hypothetical protein [Streptomyces sp. NPDC058254]|uniref:zinc finger domain-containing protein n=1 Tax=Streptomyces sp. NPDC058254 TaxID=3346406 RepID=UPI0036E5B1C2